MIYLNFLSIIILALNGASVDNHLKKKQPFQDNKYVVSVKKLNYSSGQEYDLVKLNVTLLNKTSDTLKYYTWSCTPNYIFKVDSPSLKVKLDSANCDLELPVLLKLAPFTSNSTTVVIEIKKEVKRPIRYRIGVQLIKDHDLNGLNFGLYARNFDFTMVWSNEMKLD